MTGLIVHAAFPGIAVSAPVRSAWIVTHSRPTPEQAVDLAYSLVGKVRHPIRVFQSRIGTYSVVLGPEPSGSAKEMTRNYIESGAIPADSYVSVSGRCCVAPVDVAAVRGARNTASSAAEMPAGFRIYAPRYIARGNAALGITVSEGGKWWLGGSEFRTFRVDAIKPGSDLVRHGIRLGDQIVAADGFLFRNMQDFIEYISNRQAGSTVMMEIVQAGNDTSRTAAVELSNDVSLAQQSSSGDGRRARADDSSGEAVAGLIIGGLLACALGVICGNGSDRETGSSAGRDSGLTPLQQQLDIKDSQQRGWK
jgi:membrane-associated protease RseP (regulator of RpoE activity)